MSRFVGALCTRTLTAAECKAAGSSVGLFQLVEDFTFEHDAFGPLTVPAGYVTDYASVPRGVLWYVNADDPCIAFASVIHDWLYTRKGILPAFPPALNRQQCDQVLIDGMALCGARKDQMAIVYRVLRLFGASHWHA